MIIPIETEDALILSYPSRPRNAASLDPDCWGARFLLYGGSDRLAEHSTKPAARAKPGVAGIKCGVGQADVFNGVWLISFPATCRVLM